MKLINKGNIKAGKVNVVLGLLDNDSTTIHIDMKKENPLKSYYIFLSILIILALSFMRFYR